jgi:hypothetical protein
MAIYEGRGEGSVEQSENKNAIELEDFYVIGVAGTEKRDFG